MPHIVIIGAGLTGLSAAYHLEKKGFTDYTLFEKEPAAGGLCRSVQQDGFTFDYTGHLLHISDPYFHELIASLVGFENFNSIMRRSFIYSQSTYTKYPYQINLAGLPVATIAHCIEEFVLRKTRLRQGSGGQAGGQEARKNLMFKDWVLENFGKGFGEHFFFPYQKKIFACNLNTVTADWTGRFVPSTSLEQIIQGALALTEESVGYNAHFYYPKEGGIITWVEKIAQALHNTIQTNFTVKRIDLKKKILYFTNGHSQPFDSLINTMPLDTFLSLLDEPAHLSATRAQKHLRCNSVINFNLGIAHPEISEKHWIYFPEKQYPFYRLGFPHNFAQSMAPENCSSLYGEFAHINKSKSWINNTLKHALRAAKEILNITERDIVTEKIISISHAYVIYDRWRQRNLANLLKQLEQENIYSVGRYGSWKYSSMQEAVLDGKKVAEQLIIIPATKSWMAPDMATIEKQPNIRKQES